MRELLDRLEAEDWTAAVDHFSPAYVEAEVASILQSVRPKRRLPTVDGLLKADPAMPRDVATYEVDRARRAPPPNPFYGDLYGERTDALERLHEYMKDHWMQILDDFFEELKSGTEGDARLQPSTLQEMVDMVENDDGSGFFDCEDCSDADGRRCYRNRPNPKKRPRCA